MVTLKLLLAIIAFVLSSGQVVFQIFQHHHVVNPRHGGIKLIVFILSTLSLIYLARDIYLDFGIKQSMAAPESASQSQLQAELDYWHSIYDAPSPEGYCDYLEKYPHGQAQFVSIAKNATQGGNCLKIRQEAEIELKLKQETELKERLAQEAKALAEKNAQLEKEAKENAARITALEQAKTETEAKTQAESDLEIQVRQDLNSKLQIKDTATSETQIFVEETSEQLDMDTNMESEVADKTETFSNKNKL